MMHQRILYRYTVYPNVKNISSSNRIEIYKQGKEEVNFFLNDRTIDIMI